jgi:hypothetical protein
MYPVFQFTLHNIAMWAVSNSPKLNEVFIHLYAFLFYLFIYFCINVLLTGKIHCTFKTNNREDLLKLYKVMAVPVLLYIHENCRLMKRLD